VTCGLTRVRCVTGVESSQSALALAQHNAERNGVAGRCEWVRADVADFMRASAPQAWDIVVLDPPKLAPSRKVRGAARRQAAPRGA
jgi:23S rRNA G2069 N7-methylase RlmK/C1962 C5-methylase RlmI